MKIKSLIAGTLVLHVAVLAYSAVLHEASTKITSSSLLTLKVSTGPSAFLGEDLHFV